MFMRFIFAYKKRSEEGGFQRANIRLQFRRCFFNERALLSYLPEQGQQQSGRPLQQPNTPALFHGSPSLIYQYAEKTPKIIKG
jgi:hypothetical protein